MTTLSNLIVLAGGSGGLDPALYVPGMVAGLCAADERREPCQPACWVAGVTLSWLEIWLGVD